MTTCGGYIVATFLLYVVITGGVFLVPEESVYVVRGIQMCLSVRFLIN